MAPHITMLARPHYFIKTPHVASQLALLTIQPFWQSLSALHTPSCTQLRWHCALAARVLETS